jgi:hypothetical protein
MLYSCMLCLIYFRCRLLTACNLNYTPTTLRVQNCKLHLGYENKKRSNIPALKGYETRRKQSGWEEVTYRLANRHPTVYAANKQRDIRRTSTAQLLGYMYSDKAVKQAVNQAPTCTSAATTFTVHFENYNTSRFLIERDGGAPIAQSVKGMVKHRKAGNRLFLHATAFCPALGSNQRPIQCEPGREVNHLAISSAEVKKSGAVTPLLNTSSWRVKLNL